MSSRNRNVAKTKIMKFKFSHKSSDRSVGLTQTFAENGVDRSTKDNAAAVFF